MKNTAAFLIIILFSWQTLASTEAHWLVKKSSRGEISVQRVKRQMKKSGQEVRTIREYIAEGSATVESTYQEFLYSDQALPPQYRKHIQPQALLFWIGSEVRTLVQQGDPANRIDLTIVGDGYTAAEKDKFFSDAQSITEDLFGQKTFASYLPLFNVHAVFVPSAESGLTDGNVRKNTALGLYRDPPGSKRAIMPGNTRAIERAIALAPDADYPILMANDAYYGGLGGRYAITTSSPESGKVVLRHELGHNFGEVGEEYDGGHVYDGANSSRGNNVKWSHWLAGDLKKFETKQLTGDYVWKNLSTGPYRANFMFPQGNYILDVIVSAVGWSSPDDVYVTIDGQRQVLRGRFTDDRSFFNLDSQLSAGAHVVEARENIRDGDNVLAFINMYALPADIIREKGFIGAYATFDIRGGKSYRPTFDTCIMREMTSDEFCSVDKENFWHKFLARISLIDDIRKQKTSTSLDIEAMTPPLPGLQYSWFKKVAGQYQRLATESNAKISLSPVESGQYKVEVVFKTPEVRKYNSDFTAVKEFFVE